MNARDGDPLDVTEPETSLAHERHLRAGIKSLYCTFCGTWPPPVLGRWTDDYEEETNAAMNFGHGYAEGLAARSSSKAWLLALGVGAALGFVAGWVAR